MNKRLVPKELHEEVLELITAIAQPDTFDEEDVDMALADEAMSKLAALFEKMQSAGTPDPFLTEALADFTDDDVEAVRLYRLAIEQCSSFPGEPTHTKRQGLVECLASLGRDDEAQAELVTAKREAFAAGDKDAIRELAELEQSIGS